MFSYYSDKLGHFDIDLSPDDLTIGVIYWSPPSSMSILRAIGAGNVELSLGQAIHVQGHCDLDF